MVKWILKKYNGWFAMNSTALQYSQFAGFCEHGIEPSVHKCVKSLDHVRFREELCSTNSIMYKTHLWLLQKLQSFSVL